MKRIRLCTHDMTVLIDGDVEDAQFLSAAQWFQIKLDDHADYLNYDENLGGEIQWCPNAATGRMPANEKFSKEAWSPYCDRALLDRAVAMHAQRKAEVAAEKAAAEQQREDERKARAIANGQPGA